MSGVNLAIIMGHLGRDPELRYLQSGQPVCRLNIATSRRYTNKNNEVVEETEWHRVSVWGKHAENCNNYLTKGRQVHVQGRLRTSSYDKDGQTHYTTEIVADSVQFIGTVPQRDDDHEPAAPAKPAQRATPAKPAQRSAPVKPAPTRGRAAKAVGDGPPEPDNFHGFGGNPGDDDMPF